jgi:hypothetical protein
MTNQHNSRNTHILSPSSEEGSGAFRLPGPLGCSGYPSLYDSLLYPTMPSDSLLELAQQAQKASEHLKRTFYGYNPTYGLLTWESEGREDVHYTHPLFSRKLHHPSPNSGVTIGRGYDMKEKMPSQIIEDLTSSWVDENTAQQMAKGFHLDGIRADHFVRENRNLIISPQSQLQLFYISYAFEEKKVKDICAKRETSTKYGDVNWDSLHQGIKEMLVDLKFRGDYTPEIRTHIQQYVAQNNLEEFSKIICDKKYWSNVPDDRFNRRCIFMSKAFKIMAE